MVTDDIFGRWGIGAGRFGRVPNEVAALQTDGEHEVRMSGLKHQRRSAAMEGSVKLRV